MHQLGRAFELFHQISVTAAEVQKGWSTPDIIAAIAAGSALISALTSIIVLFLTKNAINLNKSIFKRQGVIDLHVAWQGVNSVDPAKPITPEIVKAINALTLTASLWNHDVVEKVILYQTYWTSFQELYETFQSSDVIVPGKKKQFRQLLTPEITRAYNDMRSFDVNKFPQTYI